MNYLPSNLKHLRKSYGETQEELANALHLEKSTISQYENGSRKPDEEILKGLLSDMELLWTYYCMKTYLFSPIC